MPDDNQNTSIGRKTEEIITRLEQSGDPKDHRIATEIRTLVLLSHGRWRGRFEIVDFAGGDDRSLIVVLRLLATGSVWRDGRPENRDGDWLLALSLPPGFPLAMPSVQFISPIPFNPHVVDRQFLPEPARLSPELQQWLRSGGRGGQMCYLTSSQWSPDFETHNLGIVVWQVVRILTVNKIYGENVSLNRPARDFCLRLQQEGRLPLGAALPFPFEDNDASWPAGRDGVAIDEPTEDVEWSDTGEGT